MIMSFVRSMSKLTLALGDGRGEELVEISSGTL